MSKPLDARTIRRIIKLIHYQIARHSTVLRQHLNLGDYLSAGRSQAFIDSKQSLLLELRGLLASRKKKGKRK